MDILQIVGFLGAFLTGLILGLLGGGGAIISIPILVYLFHVPAENATSYSLLIIFITSLFGVYQNWKEKLIRYSALLFCGIPAVVAIFITRKFILHSLPDELFTIGSFTLKKNAIILFLLAFFMFMVGARMFKKNSESDTFEKEHGFLTVLKSIFIGVFIGLTGAGGGFLLLPLLMSYEKMSFKNATATSLSLVAINSFFGIVSDMSSKVVFDKTLLIPFIILSTAGMFAGLYLSRKTDNQKLKLIFGGFLILLSLYIFFAELIAIIKQ